MISSILAGFHPAPTVPVSQTAAERPGEIENDGDSDDGAGAANAANIAAGYSRPDHLGRAIDVLA